MPSIVNDRPQAEGLCKLEMLHTTVYASATSPCGKFFAIGNNYGHVMIFKMASNNSTEEAKKPLFTFQLASGAIYRLLTVDKLLICAGQGSIITAWSWHNLINQSKPTKVWELCNESKLEEDYITALCYSSKDNMLFSAGSGSQVITWDIKVGKKLDTYSGHSGYIHDVSTMPNGFVSASEDGSMRIWDSRNAQCSGMHQPFKSDDLRRERQGKHLTCVATDDRGDWIVCGGGPRLALFRHSMPTFHKPLQEDKEELIPNVVQFFNDEIIAGGNLPLLHRYHMNGDLKAVVPCYINSIFCMTSKVDETSRARGLPLVLAGADYKISAFTNLGYQGMMFKCV